jgi:TetR/AcrR family fatty acid metabolism transcriptional regulator
MSAAAVEKRQVILDAAVRVFARQGFHTCRVSDIADEAGVAYGLVYHYFASKEQMLDTVFLDRWDVMLAAIAEVDASERPPREKLHSVASFIIESYRHDPDVMKVIVVEVTRAANTFGRTHLAKIREAYAGISAIVADGQRSGELGSAITPEFVAQTFYGAIEQVLTGWIFDEQPVRASEFERAKSMIVELICDGLTVGAMGAGRVPSPESD